MSKLITGAKTPEQLANMRECGRMLATIYQELRERVTAGMSELDINDYVAQRIKEFGAEATYLTEEVKFPGVICVSTNEQLVHSPPTDYVFEKGDVVSFDLVIGYRDHTVSFRTQDMRTIDTQSRRIHLMPAHTLSSLKRRINRRRRTRQMRHHTLAHTAVGRLTYANDLWCTRTRIDMPNDTPNRLRSDINSYHIAR